MDEIPVKFSIPAYHKALIDWFDRSFRELPWRDTRNPYHIWISEIMLQQTQVTTVVPYYQRFISVFPTVYDLVKADLSQVLKQWEGLGYYARARNLHKAAKQIVEQFNGTLPDTEQVLRTLTGIGPYSSAAILSIAFDKQLAVVDGNVSRVLCRLFRIDQDPKSATGKKTLQNLATQLLATDRPGDYNQAIMELGALVCRPKSPRCNECPVQAYCSAYQMNETEKFPVKSPARERPHHHIAAGIIYRGDEILIAKRPESGLLGGLWEFPGGKVEPGETREQTVAREIREELGINVRVLDHIASIDHAYTHFSITLHVYACEYISGEPRAIGCADWKWVTGETINEHAFPRANRKILDMLIKQT